MPNPQTIRMQRFTGAQALVGLIVIAAVWLLLWLWLAQGVEGAGNLYRAWATAMAVLMFLMVLSLLGSVDVAYGPQPRWFAVLARMHFWSVSVVLAWTAHWWPLAAVLFCRFAGALNREVRLRWYARQEAGHAK